jgi:biopolymer transport protein ExbD
MKFPRNSKLLRSPFDMAPFAAVFFLLVIFLPLGVFLPTPGVPLHLPMAANLAGADAPTVAMAVDARGRYFFENQLTTGPLLAQSLRAAASASPAPLTLIINADQQVTYDQLIKITVLARDAGITNALLATLPSAAAIPRPRP